MANKPPKQKEPNLWDRRPWPSMGEANQGAVYEGIGRALSEWERYEAGLSFLFANFIGAPVLLGGMRVFSAVRTFEGRTEMLRAASEAFFHGYGKAASPLLDDYKSVLRGATCFSQRRNDIAHGVVDYYRPEPPTPALMPLDATFAMFPAYSTFRERNVESVPTYCYTVNELEYFRLCFAELRAPLHDLSARVAEVIQAPALREKYRRLVRGSANPKVGQTDPQ